MKYKVFKIVILIDKIKPGDNVLILSNGFTTAKEEWFLSTLEVKRANVFYTMESFIKFVKQELKLTVV